MEKKDKEKPPYKKGKEERRPTFISFLRSWIIILVRFLEKISEGVRRNESFLGLVQYGEKTLSPKNHNVILGTYSFLPFCPRYPSLKIQYPLALNNSIIVVVHSGIYTSIANVVPGGMHHWYEDTTIR